MLWAYLYRRSQSKGGLIQEEPFDGGLIQGNLFDGPRIQGKFGKGCLGELAVMAF